MRKTGKPSVRPKLVNPSGEMKAWCAALAAEIATWPNVNSRPMFGFSAYYRANKIFALLPRTRCMESPNAFAFKLQSIVSTTLAQMKRDPRIQKADFEKGSWFNFELSSDADLRDALKWLLLAHQASR